MDGCKYFSHTTFANSILFFFKGLLKASHSKVMKEKELSNKTTEESYRCRGMKGEQAVVERTAGFSLKPQRPAAWIHPNIIGFALGFDLGLDSKH